MVNRKVMIIDDDKKFLDALEQILSFSGYEMITTQDPYAVLPIAAKEKPHAILLDIKMPGKSGFQVAHELRSTPELQHIPIIAMTKFYKDGYENLMEMCDIKKCLRKPFNPLDVIMELEAVLG